MNCLLLISPYKGEALNLFFLVSHIFSMETALRYRPQTLGLLITGMRLNYLPIKLGHNNVVFLQNHIVYDICMERAMPFDIISGYTVRDVHG